MALFAARLARLAERLHYFRMWTKDGTLKVLHDVLRRKARQQEGRSAQPTAGTLDSQSVKLDSTPSHP